MRTIGNGRIVPAGTAAYLHQLCDALREAGFICEEPLRAGAAEEASGRIERVLRDSEGVLCLVSEEDMGFLGWLDEVCRKARKPLIPALAAGGTGLAGPIAGHCGPHGWAGAWRTMLRPASRTVMDGAGEISEAAGAMLAAAAVLALEQLAGGDGPPALEDRVYVLDVSALTGRLQPLFPPRAGLPRTGGLAEWFAAVTSGDYGLLHRWEEGDLPQLPLACCLVQPFMPHAEGPAGLQPAIVVGATTQAEARLGAGLAGIEAVIGCLSGGAAEEFDTLGAGSSEEEAALRAVVRWLDAELRRRERRPGGRMRATAGHGLGRRELHDEEAGYCVEALQCMGMRPEVRFREPLYGFPVAGVDTGSGGFSCTGLTETDALRRALRSALLRVQLAPEPAYASVKAEAAWTVDPALDPAEIVRKLAAFGLAPAFGTPGTGPYLAGSPVRTAGFRARREA